MKPSRDLLLPLGLALVLVGPIVPIGPGDSGAPRLGPGPLSVGTGSPSGLSEWRPINGSSDPPPMAQGQMAFDLADEYLVLFGPDTGGAGITWIFDHGVWRNVTGTAGTPPPASSPFVMTYDGADRYVVVSATGTTWRYSAGTWVNLSTQGPAPDGDVTRAVYDAADGYALFLGDYPGSAYTYRAGTWVRLPVPTGNASTPFPRLAYGLTYDSAAGYVLLTDGVAPNGLRSPDPTYERSWKFVAGTWTPLGSGGPREGWADFAYAWDAASGQAIAFSGLVFAPQAQLPTNVTWTYSGTWSRLAPGPAPMAGVFGNGQLEYDPCAGGLILFGGNNLGPVQNATWEWASGPPEACGIAGPGPLLLNLSLPLIVGFLGGGLAAVVVLGAINLRSRVRHRPGA